MKRRNEGITLIALVITIILLLILAGVVINLTLGEHGILKQTEQSSESYKISEMIEKLELEKAELYAKKNGEIPSTNEYIDHLIDKGIIVPEDVWNIDDDTKHITIEGNIYEVEKEEDGNIKITQVGKADNSPIIGKIQVTTTTTDSISVKVIASNVNEGSYKYSIKNVTAGETNFTEVTTETVDEYTFTGLTKDNEYVIQVEIVTSQGTVVKQTGIIKAEFPKVRKITLNKTQINIYTQETETIVATVLPEEALDKTVTWTSSNESVVTVDATGKIIGISEGTATITATSNEVNSVKATCNVTITFVPPPTAGGGNATHSAKSISYSWEEINEIAKVISDNYGAITNNTAEVNVTIKGKSYTLGIGDYKTLYGKQVRILGFNHDLLTDKAAYGGTNTYAGISFEFSNVIMKNTKLTNVTNYQWATLNNTTINSLENKAYIKQVMKPYIRTYNNANSVTNSNDKLWLLSVAEIWGSTTVNGYTKTVTTEGRRYKFYSVGGSVNKGANWWTRSVNSYAQHYACYVLASRCMWTNASYKYYRRKCCFTWILYIRYNKIIFKICNKNMKKCYTYCKNGGIIFMLN